MSVIIAKANIKLTDIPKEKIYESSKTGNKYLPITIVVNDTLNDFGKQGPVFVEQSKEEREAKEPKHYLGDVSVVYVDGVDGIKTTKDLSDGQ